MRRTLSCAASLLLTVPSAHALDGHSLPAQPPPAENFIVIVLDDVGTDKLSLYDGNYAPPYAATPRINQLANAGVTFTNFYVNPYCSTSRACLQTGKYAYHTGIGAITQSMTSPPGPNAAKLDNNENFISEMLKLGLPSGPVYHCGAFGKWHMTYDYVDLNDYYNANGDERHAIDNGFDHFAGCMSNVGMLDNGDDHLRWRKVTHTAGGSPVISQETRWGATVTREDAVAWINAQTTRYFAYVAFNPPHAPLQVPPYDLLSPATRQALEDLTPGPVQVPPAVGDPGNKTPAGNGELYYRAMLESVDAEIDNLLDQVQAAKPAKFNKTLVFVISDNGTPHVVIQAPHDDEHGKGTVYEIGVRVPMIVSGAPVPQVAQGEECDELVGAVDLWPTLKAYSGSNLGGADGHSFRGLIDNPSATGPNAVAFSQQFGPNGTPVDYGCLFGHHSMVTDGAYKLVRKQLSSDCAGNVTNSHELYALPNEEDDIYAAHQNDSFVLYLKDQLDNVFKP